MIRLRKFAPIESRELKSLGGIGVRYAVARSGVVESRKARELISTACRHGLSQSSFKIAEKKKRGFGGELFAHKKQRWRRGKEINCCGSANGSAIVVIRSPNARFPI